MAGKFLYGVGLLKFKGLVLGYILKDSFQMNGTKGEASDIWAEQVQSAAVKSLPQSNGTIAPSFNLIEMDYDSMQACMGGEVLKDASDKTIGWSAPTNTIQIEGEFIVETVSGQRVTIANGLFQSNLGGQLNLSTVAQIEVSIKVQMPTDGTAPYKIEDIVEEPAAPEEEEV